ncbi:tripartite tricarboxylate transporter permease [Chloroflexota bacterium]
MPGDACRHGEFPQASPEEQRRWRDIEVLLEGILGALSNFATAELWLFMVAGAVIGLIFGIIPGIGATLALTLILPFVFTMTAEQALPLMMAIGATTSGGGAIAAILFNVPGVPGSAATLIDGFPMTQKGESGRALGAAMVSCGAGSIVSALVALAMIPLVLPTIMALRNGDMVFLILLGITFIAVLGEGTMLKGLISGGLGLLISFIGWQAVTSVQRFTFGSLYLYDGIPLVPLAVGLFAVPEMIALATRGGTLAHTGALFKGVGDVWLGMKDVVHHWALVIRSSVIGFICGVIPGVGSSIACFIAYGQAKQTSKHPERFGTGTVEGVIAPESANDAKEAGALLTTLALGIPGSAVMALVLGAFLLLGLAPGPSMMTKHLDLSLTLILVIIVASIIGEMFIALPLAPLLSRIAFIPGRVLAPLVLIVAFVGAFVYQQQFEDVIVTLIFGALGLLMRRYGYNRPGLFLGYILGSLLEKYLFIALGLAGPLFFLRPISLSLILIIFASIGFGPFKNWQKRRGGVDKV